MEPLRLEQYIQQHIPLSKAMAITVISADSDTVVLQAPLAPNINHRETVFGGSASALAILASWALLRVRLESEGISDSLVIQRNSMEYRRPISGAFTARSALTYPERWAQFTQTIASKGKARVSVSAVLEYAGETAASFTGDFVALRG